MIGSPDASRELFSTYVLLDCSAPPSCRRFVVFTPEFYGSNFVFHSDSCSSETLESLKWRFGGSSNTCQQLTLFDSEKGFVMPAPLCRVQWFLTQGVKISRLFQYDICALYIVTWPSFLLSPPVNSMSSPNDIRQLDLVYGLGLFSILPLVPLHCTLC